MRQWFCHLALLGLVSGAAALAAENDQRWTVIPNINDLDDFSVAPNSPALSKSLHDAAEYVLRWKLPEDASGWKTRRPVVERALRKAIGLDTLPERTPLNARIVATHDLGDYLLQNVMFESRPGFPVTANLYRPKESATGKRAAVLCPIGHILDKGKASAEVQARCIRLARMGFVVLVYDAIGHGERMIPGNIHHEAGYALLPLGETIAGWMIWDSMRAIDYLTSLEEADSKRIGVTGNSGGGLNALFTAALDERVRAAAICGYTFQFNNWIKYAGAHCTCTQLPGLYREMEWFEIAGLIAPRAAMMLQGEFDNIFPVSGAREAGRSTETLYKLLGFGDRARFEVVPGQPHAYSRPFRERMYGWMALHLLGEGDGGPVPEGDVRTLDEDDTRLLCHKPGSIVLQPASVLELAKKKADEMFSALPEDGSAEVREAARRFVLELTAPPYDEPHFLRPARFGKSEVAGGVMEKVYFVSEIGEPVPGLLWLPRSEGAPARTVILVDDRGKQAVAESGLVEPLLSAGYAVLSVDLRGRGETLGRMENGRTNNFHLVKTHVLFGRPLAGRRAFDLKRAVDYVVQRKELSLEALAVVGIGDDALPAILAAAADPRIERLATAGYAQSFLSQMVGVKTQSRDELRRVWNSSAMRTGRINAGEYEVDLGSVIPSVLKTADLPDLVSLIAPRKVLYCGVRDRSASGADFFRSRFQRVLAAAGGAGWAWYQPDQPLDAGLLLRWLGDGGK